MRLSPIITALPLLLLLPRAARAEEKTGAVAGASGAVTIERVAAVVNDAVLLESDVVARAVPMLADIEAVEGSERAREWKKLVHKTLEQMIDEELIVEAAQEAKLEVTDDEVQKAFDEIKRQNHLTDKQLDAALQQQGTTVAAYRKDVRRQILRLRAVSMLVRPRVNVSDDDLKAKYQRLSGQSATVTEVHLRHILLPMPERPGTPVLDAARRRAGDLVDRARGGEDFAALAREASGDPATKGDGGDLGWYKRGELPTEWEEIVFGMEAGEVRGPIQGPRGLHVFQLTENKKETVRPFAEVKEQLREQLFQEEMEKQTKVWLQELHRKAHIETKI